MLTIVTPPVSSGSVSWHKAEVNGMIDEWEDMPLELANVVEGFLDFGLIVPDGMKVFGEILVIELPHRDGCAFCDLRR